VEDIHFAQHYALCIFDLAVRNAILRKLFAHKLKMGRLIIIMLSMTPKILS